VLNLKTTCGRRSLDCFKGLNYKDESNYNHRTLVLLVSDEKHKLLSIWLDDTHFSYFFARNFQKDEMHYGRGEMRLSCDLNEGDIVVYQTGSWLVDGVRVGDDISPGFTYCMLDSIQVIWTHNCEHGVFRGINLHPVYDCKALSSLKCSVDDKQVEFGPEQLMARFTVKWDGSESVCVPTDNIGISLLSKMPFIVD